MEPTSNAAESLDTGDTPRADAPGADAAAATSTAPEASAASTTTEAAAAVPATEPAGEPEPAAAPRRRSRRASAAAGEAVAVAEPASPSDDEPASQTAAEKTEKPEKAPPKKRVSRARKKTDAPTEADAAGDANTAGAETAGSDAASTATAATDAHNSDAHNSDAANTDAVHTDAVNTDATGAESAGASESSAPPKKRSSRGRGRKAAAPEAEAPEIAAPENAASENSEAPAADAAGAPEARPEGQDDARSGEASGDAEPKSSRSRSRSGRSARGAKDERGQAKGQQAPAADDGGAEESESAGDRAGDKPERNGARGNGNGEGQGRAGRTRQRERKRRGQNDDLEPEIAEDDVLLPVAGILDVLDNYAFVRTSGYLPGTGDVYVSLGQVKKYALRKGDAVVGAIRQPREGEGGGRQKYNAIVRVDTVNSQPADEQHRSRADFSALTPLHPDEQLRLETGSDEHALRLIDLFAPIGKGQRGLIVGPHESGKSTVLRQIAAAVAEKQPDAHLMLVVVDERPEDVTELERTVNGEVVASTFDRPAEDHITIAELAIERAKRLVELGHDVVVLIDSLTSLARAYNVLAPAATRLPAGTLDATAIHPLKKLLSAARNIENGGSLTIVATVSAQPGSRVDEAVLGELEATANAQLRLSGAAAERREFPAVDVRASSTRREDLLKSGAELKVTDGLRRALARLSPEEALASVLSQLRQTSSNVEFLALAQRSGAL
ncbi:transcription termination factor Rho [Leucobacter weissii]|uniref:transcription termination factor Rho n=1 Tax=Leucobacter weissii TaxID=1983706 RepID=UPI00313340B4